MYILNPLNPDFFLSDSDIKLFKKALIAYRFIDEGLIVNIFDDPYLKRNGKFWLKEDHMVLRGVKRLI